MSAFCARARFFRGTKRAYKNECLADLLKRSQVSSATVLSLLLRRSARVHLLVDVGVEHSSLRIVGLLDLLLLGLGRQELMLRLVRRRLLRCVALLLCAGFGDGVLRPALVLGLSVLARYYVDEEIEHVGLPKSGGDIAALESAAFVLLGVDPGAHGELGNEGLAGLGEYYGRFGRNHLDFRVRFHDLLDASERELVDLVVVVLGLEHGDDLLPVGVENVAVVSLVEAL